MTKETIHHLGDISINERGFQAGDCQSSDMQNCTKPTREAIAALGYASVLHTKQENNLAYWQDLSSKLEKMWDQSDEQLIAFWNTVDDYKKQLKGEKLPVHVDKVYYQLFNAHIPLVKVIQQIEDEVDNELRVLESLDLTPDNLKKSLELEDDKKKLVDLKTRRQSGDISKRPFEYVYWAQDKIYNTGEIPPLSVNDVENEAVVIAIEELQGMDCFETIQRDGSVKDWKKDPAVLAKKVLIIFPDELGN